MSVFNDLSKDQIYKAHLSERWTTLFLQNLESQITPDWTLIESNKARKQYDFAIFQKHNFKLCVNLTHNLFDNLENSIDCLISDNVVKNKSFSSLALWPECYGVYAHDFDYQDQLPIKKFNCFIHRGCTFRQSWMYHLVRRKLLDQGYVTYWCEDRVNKSPPEQHFEKLFQANLNFEKEHHWLKEKIPFKNFDISLEDAIIKSEKTLIIETYFQNHTEIALSEKIWRSIQLPRPWLLFGCPGSVAVLRDWGFDVFDDVVDHSYDSNRDPIKRQMMILDQLDKKIEYNQTLLENFKSRAEKNQQLLRKFYQVWPDKQKNVIESIKTISTNESLTSRA